MPARPKALVTAPFRGPGLDTLRGIADVVLDPWIDYLRANGVAFQVGWAADRLEMSGGRVTAASVVTKTGERRRVDADWFLSAFVAH